MLACPLCHTPLVLDVGSYRCQHGHNFDIAKEGYVNLHAVQHKKSHHAGDTLPSLQARLRFLQAGFYAPLKQKTLEILKAYPTSPNTALDIGAGVGYYTEALAMVGNQVVGLDIAKPAIKIASRLNKNTQWVVATSAVLPILDRSVGVCMSFFSPLPVSEMHRVMAKDGLVLVAVAGEGHLLALREQLFDSVRPHRPTKIDEQLGGHFEKVDEFAISHSFCLSSAGIADLVCMTPYAYKATAAARQKVLALPSLLLTAQFHLALFKPKSKF